MKKLDKEQGLTEYAIRLESSSGSQSVNEPRIEYLYLTPIGTGSGKGRGRSEKKTGVSAQLAPESALAAQIMVEAGPELRRPIAPFSPAVTPPPGAFIVGHYVVERAIGRGGMGDVYLARDTRLGRPVAVKLLRADYNPTESRVRRFHREARAVCTLNHPNIVTIYEVGESNGAPFIVSEFIEGLTLRRLIPLSGMKVHLALDIVIQIASALSAAHQMGIVHRDIKPENVMVRSDGYVKVLDFGLAKLSDALEGRTDRDVSMLSAAPGVVLGTISYMSPEQARGLNVDGRTDVFSLGIVFYEMITGQKPFTGATTSDVLAAILSKEPAPASAHVPDLPEEVQWIINNAICKNTDARYSTINEMMRDLREVKDELAMRSRQERKASSKAPAASEKALFGKSSGRDLAPIASPAEPPAGRPVRGDILHLSRETVSLQGQAGEPPARTSKKASPRGKWAGLRLPIAIALFLLLLLAAVAVVRFLTSGNPLSFRTPSSSRTRAEPLPRAERHQPHQRLMPGEDRNQRRAGRRPEGQISQHRTDPVSQAEIRAMARLIPVDDRLGVRDPLGDRLVNDLGRELAARQRQQYSAAGEGIDEGARIADRQRARPRPLAAELERPGSQPFAVDDRALQPFVRPRIRPHRQIEQPLAVAPGIEERGLGRDETEIDAILLDLREPAVSVPEEEELPMSIEPRDPAQVGLASEQPGPLEARPPGSVLSL